MTLLPRDKLVVEVFEKPEGILAVARDGGHLWFQRDYDNAGRSTAYFEVPNLAADEVLVFVDGDAVPVDFDPREPLHRQPAGVHLVKTSKGYFEVQLDAWVYSQTTQQVTHPSTGETLATRRAKPGDTTVPVYGAIAECEGRRCVLLGHPLDVCKATPDGDAKNYFFWIGPDGCF